MDLIEFESTASGVGVITLNRPEKRNAFNVQMRRELTEVLRGRELRELSAVVLRGEGKGFSAGADLREISDPGTWPGPAPASELFRSLREAEPVIIAAVHGAALGLGSGLAMASDLVVAAESAFFAYPEVQHGLVTGLTMVGLKELIPRRAAFDLVVTGRTITAREARNLGMVSEVVAEDQLLHRANSLAQEIAANSASAVKATKRLFGELDELSHAAGMRHAERVIGDVRRSADARERSAAFFTNTAGEVTV